MPSEPIDPTLAAGPLDPAVVERAARYWSPYLWSDAYVPLMEFGETRSAAERVEVDRAESLARAESALTASGLPAEVERVRGSADAWWTEYDRELRAHEALRQRIEALVAEYERDDAEHLDRFGQHHPIAAIAGDHLRALSPTEGEQPIKHRNDGPANWHEGHPHLVSGECLHGYDETTYDDRPTPSTTTEGADHE